MNLKKTFLTLLSILFAVATKADVPPPCGVYEAVDKADGLVRQGYLEINMVRPDVPDFSRTFTKGEKYKFRWLPDDFMKKPSQYFKQRTAHGFVKFRCKMLFVNTEVCMLSDPRPTADGWTMMWQSDMGKAGTCTLRIDADGTVVFTGLGTFAKEINPDGLKFVRVDESTARKDYFTAAFRSGPGGPVSDPPAAPGVAATLPGRMQPPAFTPDYNEKGEMLFPPKNSGTLVGEWVGQNVDGTYLFIRLNTAKTIFKSENVPFFGSLMMYGPAYLEEGVMSIQQLKNGAFAVYSLPLNTDNIRSDLSLVELRSDNSLLFWPRLGIEPLSQMGQRRPLSECISCQPLREQHAGMFTTGAEVQPFPLNFYVKQSFDDGTGEMTEAYGYVTTSYGQGSRIDRDMITEACINDDGSVDVVWRCGRTDIVYKARLQYDAKAQAYKVTQPRSVENEYDVPDDCYLLGGTLLRRTGALQ